MCVRLYCVGFAILIIGFVVGTGMLHVPPSWIGISTVLLAGVGITAGRNTLRERRPSDRTEL